MRLQGDRALGRLVSAVLSGGVQKTVRTLVYRPPAWYDNGPGFFLPAAPVKTLGALPPIPCKLLKKFDQNFHALRDIHF